MPAKMPCRTKSVTAKAKTLKVPNSKKPTSKTQTKSTKKKQTKAKEDTKENRCITDFFPIVSRRALAAKVKLEEFNRQIQKCIETRTDPTENLIVTHFDEKGKGIVAGTALNKGSFICEYSGDLIDLIEAKVKTDLRFYILFCKINKLFNIFRLVNRSMNKVVLVVTCTISIGIQSFIVWMLPYLLAVWVD